MSKFLHIIRDSYTIADDGHGGSADVDHDTVTDETECTGSTGTYHETAAREAVTYIRGEHLGTLEDSDWFGYPDAYSDPYDDRQTETTAHLVGDWSATERRAVARMVAWLEARDRATAADYIRRR